MWRTKETKAKDQSRHPQLEGLVEQRGDEVVNVIAQSRNGREAERPKVSDECGCF